MIHDTRDFQTKFGHILNTSPIHLTKRKLDERVVCMQEELDEFKDACKLQDLPGQADALVDLVYFALGTANMLGLPWQELWNDVHEANMRKVAGITKRGHKFDCIKPEGWVGPITSKILFDAGYEGHNPTLEQDDE
jgi:Phosphoribosyl-ATP pyrophosphohydrolase